jgi:hypothetical protein
LARSVVTGGRLAELFEFRCGAMIRLWVVATGEPMNARMAVPQAATKTGTRARRNEDGSNLMAWGGINQEKRE